MSFAILRTAKLKTGGNISGSLQHAFRERPTANADKAVDNVVIKGGNSVDEVNQDIQARTPDKYRKDAVRVVEVMITASPEAFERFGKGGQLGDQDQYFQDSLEWLEDHFGKDNVVSAQIHLDETTPHLSVYIVPNVDGKLNAKEFLGGRQKLSAMQTDFAEKVGKKYGLERGLAGSPAYHTEVKQFYNALKNKPDPMPTAPVKPKKPAEPQRPAGYVLDKAKAMLGLGKSEQLQKYERQQRVHADFTKQYDKDTKQYRKDFDAYNRAVSKDYAAAKAGAKVRDFLTGRYKAVVSVINKKTESLTQLERDLARTEEGLQVKDYKLSVREQELLKAEDQVKNGETYAIIENQQLKRKLDAQGGSVEDIARQRDEALDRADELSRQNREMRQQLGLTPEPPRPDAPRA